ncbi:hypothetical protein V6V47_30175 [Micromonospora sp. CPCC 205539]|uniref:hypothetical protein n=1 Tax=Micromonospora sp. CPCC 205539 TaxID=3122408 RepID=UPI002FEF72BC
MRRGPAAVAGIMIVAGVSVTVVGALEFAGGDAAAVGLVPFGALLVVLGAVLLRDSAAWPECRVNRAAVGTVRTPPAVACTRRRPEPSAPSSAATIVIVTAASVAWMLPAAWTGPAGGMVPAARIGPAGGMVPAVRIGPAAWMVPAVGMGLAAWMVPAVGMGLVVRS